MSRFRITIDSDLNEVFVISILVRGVCDHLGMDESEASLVDLCVVEAVTNAIKHSYRGVGGHAVSVEVSFTRERLDLEVLDQGIGMPEAQTKKLHNGSPVFEFDPADLAAIPEGGMGLEIMRRAMDEVSYSTQGGTNRVKLTKFLRPSASLGVPA